jgi:hypothetical protein
MDELEQLYGAIGLSLITFALPYLLELWKRVTGWQGDKMLKFSIASTYTLVGLLIIGNWLDKFSHVTPSGVIYLILGLILYPLPVWFGTQGVYTRFIETPSQKYRRINSEL